MQLLVRLSKFLLMETKVQFLVTLDLLMLGCGPIDLEFQIAVLDHELVALVLQLLQISPIGLLPLQQIL